MVGVTSYFCGGVECGKKKVAPALPTVPRPVQTMNRAQRVTMAVCFQFSRRSPASHRIIDAAKLRPSSDPLTSHAPDL